jgi:hypothetical protein
MARDEARSNNGTVMISKRVLGLAMFTGLLGGAAFAGSPAGIWVGDRSKDPVTDKPYSLAMTYDRSDQGSLALRCKDGAVDAFVLTKEQMFTVGERQDVVLRFGTEAPMTIQAIAREPNLLVLTKRDVATLTPFLRASTFVVRFSGLYGRESTLQFQSSLLPNSLNIVGRVLADCDIAPFPEAEITKAMSDFQAAAATKKGRSPLPK